MLVGVGTLDELDCEGPLLDDELLDGVTIGDQIGVPVVLVAVGDGDRVGFGGCVGCGRLVGEPGEVLELDGVDLGVGVVVVAELVLDDVLLGADDCGADERGDALVAAGEAEVVPGGAPWCRSTAPGRTRGSADGRDDRDCEDGDRPIPVDGIRVTPWSPVTALRVPAGARCIEVAARVLTGPAAPAPKSELRCTKPICWATRLSPGTPLTAAATPETDRVPTVIAAMTPTRARVCLVRA